MAIYTCFESSNMASTHYAERIYDCVCTEDVENGMFGHAEGVETEGGVIYNFVKGVKEGCPVLVVDQPAWTEDTSRMTNQRKDKFYVEAGVKFRARVVKINDEMALSVPGFVGTPEIEKFVTVDTTGKLKVEAGETAPEGAVMVGKIMRKRQIGSTLVTDLRTYGYERMMYTVKVESLA